MTEDAGSDLLPPVVIDVGGLAPIKRRGNLRVLVRRSEESFLPRTGTPALRDIRMAEDFAAFIGVEPTYVVVDAYKDLIPMLIEGKGDLIAAQFTVTSSRAERIAFSRSTFGVSEVVVGKKGAPNLPKTIDELNGRTVFVRKSASYAETLEKLRQEKLHNLKIAYAQEHEDAEDIVFSVTSAERDLTVVDDHILDAIETYNPQFVRLFSIADKREIAWAVRKTNPELRSAVDRFVIERALTEHQEEKSTEDLSSIKKRKVLRVLTRNNPITYFLYKGRPFGFDYQLSELLAEQLGLRLEMVVPPRREDLIPWLLEGRGDVIAASLTVTDGRRDKIQYSQPYFYINEVLVKKKGAVTPQKLEELNGQQVHVRKSSSYYETLQGLVRKGIDVKIVPVDETLETEEIIKRVAAGQIALTVADDHFLDVELAYGVEVEAAFALTSAPAAVGNRRKDEVSKGKEIAFAMRPSNPELKAYLDGFVKRTYRGLQYNMAKSRYFKNRRRIRAAQGGRVGKSGTISPYDALYKKYAKRYELDWRLMAAQSYVESRFDPNAKSWVGARGLFQVMPRTGKSLGFTRLEDPEQGVHAGIKYMHRLIERFDPKIRFKDRVWLAMASYNAGLGHVLDAQRLARAKGLDPHQWFDHVEKMMLLLAKPEYARKARHGYCRGGEPVAYVAHIRSLYQAYVEVTGR